jgi:hypothetical protein
MPDKNHKKLKIIGDIISIIFLTVFFLFVLWVGSHGRYAVPRHPDKFILYGFLTYIPVAPSMIWLIVRYSQPLNNKIHFHEGAIIHGCGWHQSRA